MNPIQWIKSYFDKDDPATMYYKRGMRKAQKHEHAGAIEDYTNALKAEDIVPEMKAMILYNRGLVLVASGKGREGAEDLNAVIEMDAAAENVKRAAHRKLARIQSRTKRIA